MSLTVVFKECLMLKWQATVDSKPCTNSQSPTFRFRATNCFLRCGEFLNNIHLFLCPVIRSNPSAEPFEVFIQIDEGSGRLLYELYDRERNWKPGKCIWRREVKKVERVLPNFKSDRRITFIVMIAEKAFCKGVTTTDPQTVRDSSDASIQTQGIPACTEQRGVQTTPPESTVPCLVRLSEDLSKILDEELDPDVEFRCDDLTTRAHRTVVSARSPVIAKMLKSDMVEGRTGIVKIQDMTAETFRQLLRYLYSGELEELVFHTAMNLYEAANQYEVRTLASRCSEFITRNLSVENAYDALIVADAHSDSEFVEVVVDYMVKNKFPLFSDPWSSFCEEQPRLANKVVNRFLLKSKWTGWEG